MRDMVDSQIIARGITDRPTIQAMRSVDRALFVPDEEKVNAYGDFPLPIGFGQTISQPFIVGYMLSQLHLKQSMRVLEIGTGSGYQTALLSRMVSLVYSIEAIPELAVRAGTTLKMHGFDNVSIRESDGFAGWPEKAPFDGIIVSAAAPAVPEPLVEQMADCGRMIIPVGPASGTQYLVLVEKSGNAISETRLLAVRFVPFISDNF